MKRTTVMISAAVALALAGCKGKGGGAKAMPTPPPNSGVTLRADGGDTVVAYGFGASEIRFPGVPDGVDVDQVEIGKGKRPVVTVHETLEHGLLMVMAVRMNDGDFSTPQEIAAAYAGAMTGATQSMPAVDKGDTTMIGQPALRFTQKIAGEGKSGIMRTWIVYDPAHKVMYQLKASHEGAATSDAVEDRFVASLKADTGAAAAPAPAPPPTTAKPVEPPAAPAGPGGVALTAHGSATIASDTVAGYQIEFPGTPTVEDAPLQTDKGARPGVTVTLISANGALILAVHRLQHDDYDPANLSARYEFGIDALRKSGVEQTENVDITLAGLAARKFTGSKTMEGQQVVLREWVAIDPKHDTMYQITAAGPAGPPDPSIDHFVASFRPAAP